MAIMVWVIELSRRSFTITSLAVRLFCNMFAGSRGLWVPSPSGIIFFEPLLPEFLGGGGLGRTVFWVLIPHCHLSGRDLVSCQDSGTWFKYVFSRPSHSARRGRRVANRATSGTRLLLHSFDVRVRLGPAMTKRNRGSHWLWSPVLAPASVLACCLRHRPSMARQPEVRGVCSSQSSTGSRIRRALALTQRRDADRPSCMATTWPS